MKVFILEDSPERLEEFQKHFDPNVDTVDIIDTCQDFQRFHDGQPYDLILLDHDLGGRQVVVAVGGFLEDHEDSGTTFVSDIVDYKVIKGNPTIVLHSYNPEGAARMAKILKTGGWDAVSAPFGWHCFNIIAAVRKRLEERTVDDRTPF